MSVSTNLKKVIHETKSVYSYKVNKRKMSLRLRAQSTNLVHDCNKHWQTAIMSSRVGQSQPTAIMEHTQLFCMTFIAAKHEGGGLGCISVTELTSQQIGQALKVY